MNKLTILGIFVADLAFFGKIPKVGETILGENFVVGPGGKGSNQSVAAGKAGADVEFITKIGGDDYGKMAIKIFKESNVGPKNVFVTNDHNTGVAAILLNKKTGENAISVVPGAAGTLTIQDIEKAKETIINSNFFLTQLEVPMEIVEHSLRIAKDNGVKTILNPAPATKLDKKIYPLIDYFIPNETEASFYLSKHISNETDAKKYTKDLLSLGIKNVIITLGDKGAYFENKIESHFEPSLELGERVVDTTGAGDAFCGAFATYLCENKSIIESIKFANAFAGISTTRIGTANSMPTRDEIEKILK